MTLWELRQEQPDRLLYLQPRQPGFGDSVPLSTLTATILGSGWSHCRVELRERRRGGPALIVHPEFCPSFSFGYLESTGAQRRREARERSYWKQERERAAAVRAETRGRARFGGGWHAWRELTPAERSEWIAAAGPEDDGDNRLRAVAQ